MKKQRPEAKYFLTLFKVEGHSTWRMHAAAHRVAFEKEKALTKNGKFPTVTEERRYAIDRITGELFREL